MDWSLPISPSLNASITPLLSGNPPVKGSSYKG